MSKLNDQPRLLDLDALNVVCDKAPIVDRLRWLEMLPTDLATSASMSIARTRRIDPDRCAAELLSDSLT